MISPSISFLSLEMGNEDEGGKWNFVENLNHFQFILFYFFFLCFISSMIDILIATNDPRGINFYKKFKGNCPKSIFQLTHFLKIPSISFSWDFSGEIAFEI